MFNRKMKRNFYVRFSCFSPSLKFLLLFSYPNLAIPRHKSAHVHSLHKLDFNKQPLINISKK